MTNINALIERAATAAASATEEDPAFLATHGAAARQFVWDRHYAAPSERARLADKLAANSPEFRVAVAATEHVLADELADDNARRARVRADNPTFFKD
jgi:hypothetical protein